MVLRFGKRSPESDQETAQNIEQNTEQATDGRESAAPVAGSHRISRRRVDRGDTADMTGSVDASGLDSDGMEHGSAAAVQPVRKDHRHIVDEDNSHHIALRRNKRNSSEWHRSDEAAATDDVASAVAPREEAVTNDAVEAVAPRETAVTNDAVEAVAPRETAVINDAIEAVAPSGATMADDAASAVAPGEAAITADADDAVAPERIDETPTVDRTSVKAARHNRNHRDAQESTAETDAVAAPARNGSRETVEIGKRHKVRVRKGTTAARMADREESGQTDEQDSAAKSRPGIMRIGKKRADKEQTSEEQTGQKRINRTRAGSEQAGSKPVDKVPAGKDRKTDDKSARISGKRGTARPVKTNTHTVEEGIEIYELEELSARVLATSEFSDGTGGRSEHDWGASGNDDTRRKGINIHLVIWGIILLILLASFIIYKVWSRGTDAKVKEGEVTNSYSVEVNDEMVYLSEAKLEGHADDGVTTILCLGNEPFSDDMTETGLAGQIRALADNVEVINASFPNSQVTCYERKYDPSEDTRDDVFNLFYVANSINIDDYSAMETVASFHDDDERYADAIETLRSTDFDKVDMIAIMYDASDYRNGASMQNPDDVNDLTTYTNCLKFAFQLIQDKYPWIRIVFLSPYYINDGESDSRTNDIGNGTLVNYWQWACDTCAANSVSFLDNYYGSVNENNYKEYTTDGIHLNEAGRLKIADHFVYTVINRTYAEYDAGNLMVANQ